MTASRTTLALLVSTAYVSLIAILFAFVGLSVLVCYHRRQKLRQSLTTVQLVFAGFAFISFLHTSSNMFMRVRSSVELFQGSGFSAPYSPNSIANWLVHSSAPQLALDSARSGEFVWWWNEQSWLYIAGVWNVLLYIKGEEFSIPYPWAYMMLGQLFSVSVASNLFYLALTIATSSKPTASSPSLESETEFLPTAQVPMRLWLPVMLSLGSVALSPYLHDTSWFLSNLVAMRALAVVPLLPGNKSSSHRPMAYHTLLTIVGCAAFIIRANTNDTLVRSIKLDDPWKLYPQAWASLSDSASQSLVGWDVVWTSISFLAYQAFGDSTPNLSAGGDEDGAGSRLLCLALGNGMGIMAASVGTVAPFAMRMQEGSRRHA